MRREKRRREAATKELIAYLHEGWKPRIQPAPATRPWMDATPHAFAYRCLPLNIANAHGWEVLNPSTFRAYWTGGSDQRDVIVETLDDAPATDRAVSLFGQGTVTFHIQALLRTAPGWNLWISGSPNRFKDGIAPLSAVVETDWAPYTFTMNWKFTRRNHWVTFEAGEPICFFFPVKRGALGAVVPRTVPMAQAPEVAQQFAAWSRSRDAFQAEVAQKPPATPAGQWQKRYYRGIDMRDQQGAADHEARLRLKPFI